MSEKIKQSKGQNQSRLKALFSYDAYLLYFYDPESLNSKIFPLYRLETTIRLKSTNETFNLSQPAFYLEGRPVFIVLRDYPTSISMEFMETEKRKSLIEKGYTASEIDAKIHSIYTQRVFRSKMTDLTTWTILILSNVLSFAVSYIITTTTMKGV